MSSTPVRIDKYLWAVRIFKTRTIAASACELEKVKLGGRFVKASRTVSEGDMISIRFGPFERTFRVKQPVHNRLPAKLVPEYSEEMTPQDIIDKMKAHAAAKAIWRQPGLGRPTKKERRDLDDFTNFDDW